MKYLISLLLLAVTCSTLPAPTQAQQQEHIFQQSAAVSTDSSDFKIWQLYSPAFIQNQHMNANAISNPFPASSNITFPFIYKFATSLIRGQFEEPFAAPNYGLGVPPPSNFINHNNITEYKLALERIHQYTVGNQ